MDSLLAVENLHVVVDGKPLLQGVSLELVGGQVHALMGPNGSGKTTLALAVAGHPRYEIVAGRVLLNGEDITRLAPPERARKGLLLAFQHPPEVEGVSLGSLLRHACGARGSVFCEFQREFPPALAKWKLESLAARAVNVGFSGGEKKRAELMQLQLLRPTVALLDEPDSGVDVDALRLIADGIKTMASSGAAVLVITHYPRILEHVPPAKVFVLGAGRVVQTGGRELAQSIEAHGFQEVGA